MHLIRSFMLNHSSVCSFPVCRWNLLGSWCARQMWLISSRHTFSRLINSTSLTWNMSSRGSLFSECSVASVCLQKQPFGSVGWSWDSAKKKIQHDTFSYAQQRSQDAHCGSGNMEGKAQHFILEIDPIWKIGKYMNLIFTPFLMSAAQWLVLSLFYGVFV